MISKPMSQPSLLHINGLYNLGLQVETHAWCCLLFKKELLITNLGSNYCAYLSADVSDNNSATSQYISITRKKKT